MWVSVHPVLAHVPLQVRRVHVLISWVFLFPVNSGFGFGPFLGPTLMKIRVRCLVLFCSGKWRQEHGRGGREGWSSCSLVVAA